MPIIVGIDGTDDSWLFTDARAKSYDEAFANSFVRKIAQGKPNGLYLRGPVSDGRGLYVAISNAVSFIQAHKNSLPNEPVLLTGYSRGALGVVVVAKRLKALNLQVKALMMFDCVDRDSTFDAATIPDNVENVCHVIRDPAGKSRRTFGNDGLHYHPRSTKYDPIRKFMCTHGGMGGVPWVCPPGGNRNDYIDEGALEGFAMTGSMIASHFYHTNITYAQDEAVSRTVWTHVMPFLAAQGFSFPTST